jgi:hypothetical protein
MKIPMLLRPARAAQRSEAREVCRITPLARTHYERRRRLALATGFRLLRLSGFFRTPPLVVDWVANRRALERWAHDLCLVTSCLGRRWFKPFNRCVPFKAFKPLGRIRNRFERLERFERIEPGSNIDQQARRQQG